MNPVIGISFDSLKEAYDFYNLYSWEIGFGIRYARSRLNVHRAKCMQEIVCGCTVIMIFSCFVRWMLVFYFAMAGKNKPFRTCRASRLRTTADPRVATAML